MAQVRTVTETAARSTGGSERPAVAAAGGPTSQEPASAMPDRELMIREVAYGYFVERGCAEGHDLDDGLKAEQKVAESRRGEGPGVIDMPAAR